MIISSRRNNYVNRYLFSYKITRIASNACNIYINRIISTYNVQNVL